MRSALLLLTLVLASPSLARGQDLLLEVGPVHLGDANHGPVPGCTDQTGTGPTWTEAVSLLPAQSTQGATFTFEASALHDEASVHLNGTLIGTFGDRSPWCDWQEASFDVTGLLAPGTNEFSITVGQAAGLDNALFQAMTLTLFEESADCTDVFLLGSTCTNHLQADAQVYRDFLGIPITGGANSAAFDVTFHHAITAPVPITRVEQIVTHVDDPDILVAQELASIGNGEYRGTVRIGFVNDTCLLLQALLESIPIFAAAVGIGPEGFFVPVVPTLCGPDLGPNPHFAAGPIRVYLESQTAPCELIASHECANFPPYTSTLAGSIRHCYDTPECWAVFGGFGPYGVKTLDADLQVGIETDSGLRFGTIEGTTHTSLPGVLIDDVDTGQFLGALSEPFTLHLASQAGTTETLLEMYLLRSPIDSGFVRTYRIPPMTTTSRARLAIDNATLDPPLAFDADGDGIYELTIHSETGVVRSETTSWGSLKARY